MKISKSVLKAVAIAVTISTVTAACTDANIGPGGEKTVKAKKADPCPGCGMG